MKRAGALGLVVALLASLSAGSAAANARTEMGPGLVSCGAWLASTSAMRYGRGAWVLGYLSRAAHAYPGDLLAPLDSDAVTAWLDNYCRAHPLEDLAAAASTLEGELAHRWAQRGAK